jgi:hypothetical protein
MSAEAQIVSLSKEAESGTLVPENAINMRLDKTHFTNGSKVWWHGSL